MNLYLVRHAHAGDRHDWEGPDAERPLSKKGRRQAEALADVLGMQPIGRVLSSPATRCLQTAGPVAARLGIEIEVMSAFAEGAPLAPARTLIDALALDGKDALVSGHGDLIPEVLEALEYEGLRLDGAGCAKGSIWHLVSEGPRFVQAVYYRSPDSAAALGS